MGVGKLKPCAAAEEHPVPPDSSEIGDQVGRADQRREAAAGDHDVGVGGREFVADDLDVSVGRRRSFCDRTCALDDVAKRTCNHEQAIVGIVAPELGIDQLIGEVAGCCRIAADVEAGRHRSRRSSAEAAAAFRRSPFVDQEHAIGEVAEGFRREVSA